MEKSSEIRTVVLECLLSNVWREFVRCVEADWVLLSSDRSFRPWLNFEVFENLLGLVVKHDPIIWTSDTNQIQSISDTFTRLMPGISIRGRISREVQNVNRWMKIGTWKRDVSSDKSFFGTYTTDGRARVLRNSATSRINREVNIYNGRTYFAEVENRRGEGSDLGVKTLNRSPRLWPEFSHIVETLVFEQIEEHHGHVETWQRFFAHFLDDDDRWRNVWFVPLELWPVLPVDQLLSSAERLHRCPRVSGRVSLHVAVLASTTHNRWTSQSCCCCCCSHSIDDLTESNRHRG